MLTFPAAFVLTVASEALVLWALWRTKRPIGRIALAALIANTCTHPLVYLWMPSLFSRYGTYLVAAETFAFAVESPILRLVLRAEHWSEAIRSSALANGGSYLVGMLLSWISLGRLPGTG